MCKDKPDPDTADTNNTGEEGLESSRTQHKYVFTEPKRAQTEASGGRDFQGMTFTFSKELSKEKTRTIGSDDDEEDEEYNDDYETERERKEIEVDLDDEEALCIICFTNEANCVLLDCGHGGVCLECSMDAMK